jgi:hypothetical protein
MKNVNNILHSILMRSNFIDKKLFIVLRRSQGGKYEYYH